MKTIILGSGCFWCSEGVFQIVPGVISVIPGYAGGITENPTYEDICGGDTQHAEVVKVTYSPDEVSLKELLELFFKTHDPTSLNRQGNDVGTQYRSVIYYQDSEDEKIVQEELEISQAIFSQPIVTEVRMLGLSDFHEAEEYHHNYFKKNPHAGYCQYIVAPKVAKSQSWVDNKK